MKKWLLLTVGSMIAMNAQAESFCGYKDFFHINYNANPAMYIVNGYSDADVYLQLASPRSFIVRDTPACRSGYAHVTIAYDANHWCELDIKDGPFMSHPSVNASCNGMRYLGLDYDGVGSYSYSINLD